MKKLILTSVIVLFTLISFSQKARFGLVGSPEINWMKPDVKGLASKGVKFGVNYGLNFDLPMGNNAAFSSGILIDNTGGNVAFTDTIPFQTLDSIYSVKPEQIIEYKLQYLTIPIGLKLKTNEIGYITYFAHVGINAQINIGSKAKVGNLISNEKINREVGTFNMNYHIGAGIEYSLSGTTALLLGLYYNNGFLDITTIPKVDVPAGFSDERIKDKVILNNVALKIGIMF
ncbi:MAG: hypothetical protein A2046_05455 [Bacteroidetes bacterium GWA2_30_7]|nr:MAG: hypothetical protein A2046_05455 [Bacteroidetes bacterium GWA2_30_7]